LKLTPLLPNIKKRIPSEQLRNRSIREKQLCFSWNLIDLKYQEKNENETNMNNNFEAPNLIKKNSFNVIFMPPWLIRRI
jgi:phage pi2 protein 07